MFFKASHGHIMIRYAKCNHFIDKRQCNVFLSS